MGKYMLSLQSSFKEATDKDYTENIDNSITFSETELKEFVERVNKLTKK